MINSNFYFSLQTIMTKIKVSRIKRKAGEDENALLSLSAFGFRVVGNDYLKLKKKELIIIDHTENSHFQIKAKYNIEII